MEICQTKIVIIRGAPASGKSQTAKCLAKLLPNGVRLEIDTLRQMVVSVDWINQSEHISILQASAGLVYDFLKAGFRPIIVVDTFSGDKLDNYLTKLYQLEPGFSIKVFGLTVTEDELRKRTDMRSDDEFRDFDVCRKLNMDVLRRKYDGETQIDTSNLSAEQTAEIVYEGLVLENLLSEK
jgi:hypothetical protein